MNFKHNKNKLEFRLGPQDIDEIKKRSQTNALVYGNFEANFYMINPLDGKLNSLVKSSYEKEYVEIVREKREMNFYFPQSIIERGNEFGNSIFKRELGNLYTKPDSNCCDNMEIKVFYSVPPTIIRPQKKKSLKLL